MNIPIKPQICPKHKQPIVLQDPKGSKNLFCFACIQDLTGFVPPDEVQKEQQQLLNQSKKEINEEKQQLQSALDAILNYKKKLNESLDKITQGIADRIETIDQLIKNEQELIEFGNDASIAKLMSDYQIQKQSNQQLRNQTKSQLQDFQLIFWNIDKLTTLLDDKTKGFQQDQKKDLGKFKYELIKESSRKQDDNCQAFVFNKDGTLLFVACGKEIIIYQFLNDKMTMVIQRLTNHTAIVGCLYFMKQTNSFVSGSWDHSIIIWELDKTSKWVVHTQLKGHEGSVQIIMNKNEDVLISGSSDSKVKFWLKINNQWICQQTINLQGDCQNLSLNEQENRLVSCGDQPLIYVMQLQSENSWSLVQIIKIFEQGYRLSFLYGDQFIFQPRSKDILELYNYDTKQKQFQKQSQIKIPNCQFCYFSFPIQFIKGLEIVTVKHGQFLNIFKVNVNNDLMLMQTIDFIQASLFGIFSDNGKYLATWDANSKEIQIRQLRYLE